MSEPIDLEISNPNDMLYLAGGLALGVMGLGLVMTHPQVRKAVMDGVSRLLPEMAGPLKNGIAEILPDVERYLKVRAM